MGNIDSLLTQDEINALLSGSVLSHDRPLTGRGGKKEYISRPVSLDERIAMVKNRHESQKGVRS